MTTLAPSSYLPDPGAPGPLTSSGAHPSRTLTDKVARAVSGTMYVLCAAASLLIVSLLVLIAGYLLIKGASSLSATFFLKNPIADPGNPLYPGGMHDQIFGTGVLVGMAGLVGIPLGILVGVYLSEYEAGSWLAAPVRFVADVLAGVPSIVVGILGYELLVVPFGNGALRAIPYFGQITSNNAFAGAAALAFIMIPLVARTTEEMLRLVPDSYRQASIALGATRARTILRVVLPSVTGSIVTGIMLAIARIAGETAPLLFTVGNNKEMTSLRQPFPSLTVQIYDYASGADSKQKLSAWAGMIVLVALVFVLNLAIRFFTRSAKAR